MQNKKKFKKKYIDGLKQEIGIDLFCFGIWPKQNKSMTTKIRCYQ